MLTINLLNGETLGIDILDEGWCGELVTDELACLYREEVLVGLSLLGCFLFSILSSHLLDISLRISADLFDGFLAIRVLELAEEICFTFKCISELFLSFTAMCFCDVLLRLRDEVILMALQF